MKSTSIVIFLSVMFAANANAQSKGLKDYYKFYFPIGVAVAPSSLKGDEANLILQQFNSLTPENAMKWGLIHPQPNKYNWAGADSIVDFAMKHGLKVRGHTLCWYQQTPDWVFKNDKGELVSKDVLLQRLKEHINAVVSRYKGKVYAWDVVNEVIDDNDSVFFRNSLWYRICGADFIYKAFEFAHAADPQAVLFYNDYNTCRPAKREKIYKLLKDLKARKIPVSAVGMQGHWSINEPSQSGIDSTIRLFASTGLKVQITELDISVFPGNQSTSTTSFTPDLQQKQIDQYRKIFEVFRAHKNEITGVTFWNVSDRHSWLDNYPVRGRKNYPLLFDSSLQPKKAYWQVLPPSATLL